ncbi:unnamed protein product [Gordionus sp. m RMFG-2023]
MLFIEEDSSSSSDFRFSCHTCPYILPLTGQTIISKRRYPKLKNLDDVLGGSQAWENVDSIDSVTCPKCELKGAYFMQIQTRSADEPMTTFYKCKNAECNYQWRE